MPTRILRDGIIDSKAFNSLSEGAQNFYYRLISVVDDYGRYEANKTILRAKMFAYSLENWPENRVEECLIECSETFMTEDEPLVSLYTVGRKKYLQINNFGQRTRSDSKYPAPGELPAARRSGRVYFIQGELSKRVKIGYTEMDPKWRVSRLQTGSPERLTLLGFLPGTPKDERELHRKFSDCRATGEWFNPAPGLLQFISDFCATTSDIGAPTVDSVVPVEAVAAQSPPSRARTTPTPTPTPLSQEGAGNQNFDSEVQSAWPWFVREYPGQLNEEFDARMFISVIQTWEELAALKRNLSAWKLSRSWVEGFPDKAENFLRKRMFMAPPKVIPSAIAPQRQMSLRDRTLARIAENIANGEPPL